MLRNTTLAAASAAAGILLAACTNGQQSATVPFTAANVQANSKIAFTVGTANYNGAIYLNTVATFRQANGLSATLLNSPTITGPAGFTVPAAGSGTDAGTNTINSTPPTQPGTTAVATTFGQTGGVFAYGIVPENSTIAASVNTLTYPQLAIGAPANSAIFADTGAIVTGTGKGTVAKAAGGPAAITGTYTQPLYLGASSRLPFVEGPPVVPDFHNGTYPTGFLGYNAGFLMFAAPPVAGAYTLNVAVPSANVGVNAATFSATANLTNATPLPIVTFPAIVDNGDGSAAFTVAGLPAGATNQYVFIVDVRDTAVPSATFYTIDASAGAGTYTLSATSGPTTATGQASAPFKKGDSVFAYLVAADYAIPSFGPPTNLQQVPNLPAQADISVSQANEIVY